MTQLRLQLGRLTDQIIPLSPPDQHALYLLLANPTMKRWDAAYQIVVRPKRKASLGLHLWEAWMALDSQTPVLRTNLPGQPWSHIPTRAQVVQAIAFSLALLVDFDHTREKAA